jgi:DNA-binding MarR family transcriptional regulator
MREADRIAFPRLQETLRMTAGNLSVHLRKLEDAGYVEITKTHHGRTPTTLVRLTRRGHLAFEDYTAALRALLNPTEES